MSESEPVTWDEAAAESRELPSERPEEAPLQAHWLARLGRRERDRFRRAGRLLSAGRGPWRLALADVPLAGLGVYEALLARSWAVRFADAEEMVHLAEAAVEVAQDLEGRSCGARRAADLQARAWGELANAWRVADRLGPAQQAFGQAWALLPRGTGDPYLKARLLDLEASLLGTLGEFPRALRLLAGLAGLYGDLGEPHLAGRALVTRALYTFYSGDAEAAVRLSAEGLARIDRRGDPALLRIALHNHLLFLVDLGRYPLAKRALFENRRHLVDRDRLTAVRLRWLEGRISYGLGELLSAEIAFRESQEGFGSAGQAFAAAIARLNLAMVLARREDRVAEAQREVSAARQSLLALETCRLSLGAVAYLEESLRRREATPELFEVIIALLWRRELQAGSRPSR